MTSVGNRRPVFAFVSAGIHIGWLATRCPRSRCA
jgi:hypothetical protein